MISDARKTSDELGKFKDMSEEEKQRDRRIVGLGALKYFILKVDARKNMLFNPPRASTSTATRVPSSSTPMPASAPSCARLRPTA
jgi:arginyl-tRNA synthetase